MSGAPQTAIERGLLRADANRSDSPPNLPLVLSLAAQIAEGMAFLHARDVLHGDLCGGAAHEVLSMFVLLLCLLAADGGARACIENFCRCVASRVDPLWSALCYGASVLSVGSGGVSAQSVASHCTQGNCTRVLRGLADKVLLASAPEDGPGALRAKVADFGMAREMQMQSKHQTRTYGTITHMAPGARLFCRRLRLSGVVFASESGRRQTRACGSLQPCRACHHDLTSSDQCY